MPDAVVDTHALVWYLEDSPRLGSGARAVFDSCDRGESVLYVMPDRIIAATALHLGIPIVSRDRRIRLSNVETIW